VNIIIPTRFDRPTLAPLVDICKTIGRVILIHTEPGHPPMPGTTTVHSEARNIHTWWNLGLNQCDGPALILNDDLIATHTALETLAAELDTADLVYLGGRGGPSPMTGWCFGLPPDKIRPDEAFEWWYGDDDMYRRAVVYGLTVRAVEAPEIVHNKVARFADPNLEAATVRDERLYRQRWG